jgi:hypothetical protein
MHGPDLRTNDPWQRLIAYLNEWANAREVPGGIEITFIGSAGRSRTVEVVMTPEDWDDFIGTMYGGDDPRPSPIQETVLGAPDGVPYLVYDGTYGWAASETRELPVVDLDLGPGGWFVTDKDGQVVSRFADMDDTP